MIKSPMLPFDDPERWVPIAGYEGLYEVSDHGRVWSHQRRGGGKRGGFLKPVLMGHPGNKYLTVALYRNGTRTDRPVHQLVAEAFIGPRPHGHEVRHGPGGCLDNRAVNLRYGTVRENAMDRHRDGTMALGERHKRSKLTTAQVQRIRLLHAQGARLTDLGREFGVSPATIAQVVSRKTWKHVA